MEEGSTRVVVVTGRRAAEIAPLLGTRVPPEVWGSHGWERLSVSGTLSIARAPQAALDALIAANVGADRALRSGARIERKPSSLAVHWRGLAQERALQIRAAERKSGAGFAPRRRWRCWISTAAWSCAIGRTKADAVVTVLQECGPDIPAAFLGDDLTDEDGFAALQGRGLAILARTQSRPTAAQAWLRAPEELLAFLQRWQQARAKSSSSRGA